MTKEEKQLLLVDLCARLPYGVKCQFEDTIRVIDGESSPFYDYVLSARHIDLFINHINFYIKPYLRPMSSMTDEEKEEFELLANRCIATSVGFVHFEAQALIDWLDKNMFDHRGLIPKGLALEATEKMYGAGI